MEKEPIIALDFPVWEDTEQFLQLFSKESLYVKVGMELYLQNGPIIIEKLKEMNHRIFLDLKLHDIPNTVQHAMKGLANLGVDMINVHAAGGERMMAAAREGLEQGAPGNRPLLLAVTQLTSTSETQMHREQLIPVSLEESVLHYAKLTKAAGCDGVVCSVHEAARIREVCGAEFVRVTPGIRMKEDEANDQKRIADPAGARALGSSMIVVGRSITKAADPVKAYQKVKQQWGEMTDVK
ncbi:orotidine-5'-phosphate decarboxylase [Pseudobacillus badius]|uniref:orotidine-5'-phosphate decarboxylase n=1 Tax=Bacillus badius TaxID=1455 RepID=UPI001CBD3ACD|nr:orotidine-5'-phosphate decarboxylase [Bacillus badius]UAT31756.1 orotidine-5'-phosphate decarboxylase [Bacillus badius]GLY10549.1 orotidine 5'-phosphate decarboxylase [Bacillus badius]